jgi:hypothetical protein
MGTNCYTVKLNRHTDKVLLIIFLHLSVFKIHKIFSKELDPQINRGKLRSRI